MTFIAEDGVRTVTNGTVYDRRKLYEIKAGAILDEVQSVWGTGEVEKTGATVNEKRVYHVIATSEDLAVALFKQNWGSPFQRHTLLSVRVLFVIDAEIETGHR